MNFRVKDEVTRDYPPPAILCEKYKYACNIIDIYLNNINIWPIKVIS